MVKLLVEAVSVLILPIISSIITHEPRAPRVNVRIMQSKLTENIEKVYNSDFYELCKINSTTARVTKGVKLLDEIARMVDHEARIMLKVKEQKGGGRDRAEKSRSMKSIKDKVKDDIIGMLSNETLVDFMSSE